MKNSSIFYELYIDDSGNVSIKTENFDTNKFYGTNLVSTLISSKSVVTINSAVDNSAETNRHGIIEGQKVVKDSGEIIVGTAKRQQKVKVNFNPYKTTGGVNEILGGRDRPVSIGLGHELIHARTNISGNNDFTPNIKGVRSLGSRDILSQDEYNTRVEENLLRDEQDMVHRKIGNQWNSD